MEPLSEVSKWGIKIDRLYPPKQWSIGISLSHWMDETYLYINLIFISIAIGKVYMVERDDSSN